MGGITDPAEEYFKDGLWGWDGSQWRKLGILLGYRSALSHAVANYNASAGINTLETDAVETGYIWVVETIATMNDNHAPSRVAFTAYRSGFDYPVLDTSLAAASTWTVWTGQIVLVAGDTIRAYIFGCTAGDDLYLRALGYKVAIA